MSLISIENQTKRKCFESNTLVVGEICNMYNHASGALCALLYKELCLSDADDRLSCLSLFLTHMVYIAYIPEFVSKSMTSINSLKVNYSLIFSLFLTLFQKELFQIKFMYYLK